MTVKVVEKNGKVLLYSTSGATLAVDYDELEDLYLQLSVIQATNIISHDTSEN